jgi:hypothetical protein
VPFTPLLQGEGHRSVRIEKRRDGARLQRRRPDLLLESWELRGMARRVGRDGVARIGRRSQRNDRICPRAACTFMVLVGGR